MATPDLEFCNVGPFVTCVPMTDAGRDWIAENVGDDVTTYGAAICIEPRYLSDIVLGARADGLICEG